MWTGVCQEPQVNFAPQIIPVYARAAFTTSPADCGCYRAQRQHCQHAQVAKKTRSPLTPMAVQMLVLAYRRQWLYNWPRQAERGSGDMLVQKYGSLAKEHASRSSHLGTSHIPVCHSTPTFDSSPPFVSCAGPGENMSWRSLSECFVGAIGLRNEEGKQCGW